jgi:hypothetical protein
MSLNTIGSISIEPPTISLVSPAVGDPAGGAHISITGTGFLAITAAKINGVACTGLVVLSDTYLICVTPALGAGTYNVVLEGSLGNVTLTNGFEVWSPTAIAAVRVYDSALGVTGNPVSAWADQGAGAKNLAQGVGANQPSLASPRFDGQPGLVCDGVTNASYLSLAARLPLTAGKSAFWVSKHVSSKNTYFTGYGVPLAVLDDSSGGTYQSGPGFSAGKIALSNYSNAHTAWEQREFGDGYNDGTPRAYGLTHDSGTGDIKAYVNGVQVGSTLNSDLDTTNAKWDSIGAGNGPLGTGFQGEIAGVVVTENVISGSEVGKVSAWLESRFVRSSYGFSRVTTTAPWTPRDGAGLVYFKGFLFLMGGWNNTAPFHGNTTTNEVWTSVDGVTWSLLLDDVVNPPQTGGDARWRRRHTCGWLTHIEAGNEYLYVIGGDPFDNVYYSPYPGDVWRSRNGVHWERVADGCPWIGRVFHMSASFQGRLYVLGGQTDWTDKTTALQEVWESTDAGLTWHKLTNASWSKRGLVFNPVVFAGKLWVIGGGTYDANPVLRDFYNDVWSWDGTTWTQVLADGVAPWAKRQYHTVKVFDDKLWVINGYTATGNVKDVWSSPDGVTWTEQTIAPWDAGHADGFAVVPDGIVHATGNALTQSVFKIKKLM